MELASILEVHLRDLVTADGWHGQPIPLVELPDLIHTYVARVGISIEQFEDELGWELREFIDSPIRVAGEIPIVFLQTLAGRLGIDWLSLVPGDATA